MLATNRNGYGSCSIKVYGAHLAHRASYGLFNGDIPDGLVVMHSCDVPKCVNPKHLSIGTHADNVADKYAKGRQRHLRGEQIKHAKLTVRDVRQIRQRYRDGRSSVTLAKEFDVVPYTIRNILRGITWKHVQ